MNMFKGKSISCLLVVCSIIPAISSIGVEIDPDSRWQVRDFHQAVYSYGDNLSMNWTGSYTTGDSGFVSGDWLEATRVRVNYFRTMAGVPGNITFNEALNAKCQDAALIMSANNVLSHTPPSNLLWWTQDGYDAASNGNLAIGSAGAESIEGYMADFGSSNYRVGHRRWVLYPPTTVMASGDVPGDPGSGIRSANALWVIWNPPGARPATRDEYIAWPPRGYVPADLVFARWSFSYPGASFANTTVTMESGGNALPVRLEPQSGGIIGDNSIVWVPNNMGTDLREDWPTPLADETIHVTVSNVAIGGQSRDFNYSVTIFDPQVAGGEEFTHEATLMAKPVITAPIPFSVATRPWAEAVQGRVLTAEPYNTVHNAEGGINTLTAFISEGYEPIQTTRKASGSYAFHLANPDSIPQTLTIPGEFIVGASSPSLNFASSLAWASEGQHASVDINTGSGNNWQPIWQQSGLVQTNNSFTNVAIDLSPWAGQTARFRFRYDHTPGTQYFPQTDDYVGWAFDNVSLTGATQITSAEDLAPVAGDNTIRPVFETTNPVYVQARSIAFDGIPLDWGPVTAVTPEIMTSVEVPFAQWADDPVLGWMYGASASWKYSLVMGYVYVDAFPWLYTSAGWAYYLTGSVYNGLWLYDAVNGFAYTQHNYGGWYQHSPFDNNSWKRFFP